MNYFMLIMYICVHVGRPVDRSSLVGYIECGIILYRFKF